MFLRRGVAFVNPRALSWARKFCSEPSNSIVSAENEAAATAGSFANSLSRLNLSPLFPDDKPHSEGYNVELVDDEAWRISSGLAEAWRGINLRRSELETVSHMEEEFNELDDHQEPAVAGDRDFDEIDNMRIRGNLFFKLDRNSKEFEEYDFDFHRWKRSSKDENPPKQTKSKNQSQPTVGWIEKLPEAVKKTHVIVQREAASPEKRLRTPTFNQLTAPYHEPFCLDIYISKGSVRACVVHRVSCKVVAVAHSISKDLKSDLTSRRDSAACAAVGAVLAQRALADDIHDVVYTPRKGERIEGKIQIVLQSIIDGGINVKVKIKQRKPKKANHA